MATPGLDAPADVAARLNQAVAWHRQGQWALAENAYAEILRGAPRHSDALHLRGVVLTQLGRAAEGVASIQQSLRWRPDQPGVHANLGNALAALGRLDEALRAYERSLKSLPGYAPALHGSGNVLTRLGRCEEAVSRYRAAIDAMPSLTEAHVNQGLALSRLDRTDEALQSFERALALAPGSVTALLGAATVRLAHGDVDGASRAFEQLLAIEPRHAAALAGRGQVLLERGRPAEALAAFDAALDLEPDRPATLFLRGRVLMQLGRPREAARCFKRLRDVEPELEYAAGARLWAELHACAWDGHAALLAHIEGAVREGRPSIYPFVFFSVSDSSPLQLRCAQDFARRARRPPPLVGTRERRGHERIRLAYVSEDFRSHPTAYLMMGVWELHERRRFETVAVSLRPREESAVGRRIDAAFDHFIDASSLNDAEIAQRMHDLDIDIAVDLMGYTGGTLRSILARRPAPIQVNYLGYPGTLGSPDADYLIADEFLIPRDQQEWYTENIVYLPGTYQPNDHRRVVADVRPSRLEAGLPEAAFVFCSFNNGYKLNPRLFDVWCRLLGQVPDSVLWLRPGVTDGVDNLRAEAAARGVEPRRLILAPDLPNPQHLARIALADLCLDTSPVNGATTTSDALWAGVPVITCAGKSFVSRMAGSLLTGVGLPELITANLEDYEALALGLARDPKRLAALRSVLAQRRRDSALFDTARTVRHLEAAFTGMWERQSRGEPPQGFAVLAESV